jgi:hypothetical protein
MMKKFVCLVFILVSINSFSQEENENKIQLSEVQVLIGNRINATQHASIDYFKRMAPNSEILGMDYSEYRYNNYSSILSSGNYNALLGFQFKEKKNLLLRLGVGYSFDTYLQTNAYKEEHFAYDTLVSMQTSQMYFIDSVSTSSTNAYGTVDYVSFDASLVYRTNAEKRWSFYGGLGLNFALGFNNIVNVGSSKGAYITATDGSPVNWTRESTNEMYSVRNPFSATLFLPLGVDFRIGEKREFWEKVHLMSEIRPSISLTDFPDYVTVVAPSMIYSFGVKFKW